ncbi:MAG: FitA-like ribbon-helix-helix domain-containing protein [Candidatus Dormibacteria bacterium]
MATIQIRNVPEHVHRVYRMRAAASGKSLQEYLLAELERNAGLLSPSELVAEVEAERRREPEGWSTVSGAEIIRELRGPLGGG